jgi:hypothetical protein
MDSAAGSDGAGRDLHKVQGQKSFPAGVVAEWLNAAVLKTAERETVP